MGIAVPDYLLYIYIGLSFLLFVGYSIVSTWMIPYIPIQSTKTKFAGGLFFLTCGVIYLHAMLYAMAHGSLYFPGVANPLIIILYVIQLASATIFIRGFVREFKQLRNVVRLNQEVDEMIEEVEVLRREAQERKS